MLTKVSAWEKIHNAIIKNGVTHEIRTDVENGCKKIDLNKFSSDLLVRNLSIEKSQSTLDRLEAIRTFTFPYGSEAKRRRRLDARRLV